MGRKNTFLRDREVGKQAERKVAKFFADKAIPTTVIEWENKEDAKFYDLGSQLLPEMTQFTTEVKHDVYENKSGNIAIEVANTRSGKDSGIFITGADLWCHVLLTGMYITHRQTLFAYIHTKTPTRIIPDAGDGNACIYLYPSEQILSDVFHRFDEMSQEELYRLLRELLDA